LTAFYLAAAASAATTLGSFFYPYADASNVFIIPSVSIKVSSGGLLPFSTWVCNYSPI
jgi:hypothetical protein